MDDFNYPICGHRLVCCTICMYLTGWPFMIASRTFGKLQAIGAPSPTGRSQLLVAMRRGHLLPVMHRASPAPTNNRQGLTRPGAKNM